MSTRLLVSHSPRHGENPPRRRKRAPGRITSGALTVHADTLGRSLERVEAFVVLLELEATEADRERWDVEELRAAASALRDGVSRLRAEALLAGEGRKRGPRRPVPAAPVSGALPSGSGEA